jgi:5-methylcytosine-specific restriction endonuclease McrA
MKKYTNILVLNRAYIPVHIIDWKKAISLIYQESAKPLDRDLITYSFNEWLEFSKDYINKDYPKVNTVNNQIAIPEIIILKNYDRLPIRDVKFSRQTLFERDNFKCYLCNESFERKDLTIDHIVPRSKGGKTSWENTISCCKSCNYLKGDKDLSQLNLKPFFMPKKPRWISPLNRVSSNSSLESWTKFMDRTLVDIGDK